MKAWYFGKSCFVFAIDKGQALIQLESGKQPKWVDLDFVRIEGGRQ